MGVRSVVRRPPSLYGRGFRLVYLVALGPLGAVILAVTKTRFPPLESSQESKKTGLYGNVTLLLIAFVVALSSSRRRRWSTGRVYLRNTLALPALMGASGVAVYHASMATGRLISASVISRFGNRPTLRAAGLLVAGGMALALMTRESVLVVCGLLVVGLALSAVVPIALSLAGDMFPERSGGVSSVVTNLGYGGFLLGPILVGTATTILNLHLALGVVVLAGIIISTLAGTYGER